MQTFKGHSTACLGITRFAFSSRIKTDETGTTPLAALVAGEI